MLLPVILLVTTALFQIIVKYVANIYSLLVGIASVLLFLLTPLWIVMLVRTTKANQTPNVQPTSFPKPLV